MRIYSAIIFYCLLFITGSLPCFAQSDDVEEKPFKVVEVTPTFPGGEKEVLHFFSKSLKYPVEAADNNIEGRVVVQFKVGRDGSISDVEAIESPDPTLSAEAVRVAKMQPKWIPGSARGKPVSLVITLPVVFKLTGVANQDSIEVIVKPDSIPIKEPEEAFVEDAEGAVLEDELRYFLFNKINNTKEYEYPISALQKGIWGYVVVNFKIGKDGIPGKINLIQSLDPSCDRKALLTIAALEEWNRYLDKEGRETSWSAFFKFDWKNGYVSVSLEADPIPEEGIQYPNPTIRKYWDSIRSQNRVEVENEERITKADYPGGEKSFMEFFRENVRMPEILKERTNRVGPTIIFKVAKTGEIKDVRLAIGTIYDDCDNEGLRLVNIMPDWTPAKDKDGNPIDTYCSISFTFSQKGDHSVRRVF